MSITTRSGDGGTTSLLFGREVAKSHPRVEAAGAVDELNAVLGIARVQLRTGGDGCAPALETICQIQADLIALMGELAVVEEDLPRYRASRLPSLSQASLAPLDRAVERLEKALPESPDGWATPGATGGLGGAWLDLARAVCRRAERAVCAIEPRPEIPAVYLNRLSDVLWLLARHEGESGEAVG